MNRNYHNENSKLYQLTRSAMRMIKLFWQQKQCLAMQKSSGTLIPKSIRKKFRKGEKLFKAEGERDKIFYDQAMNKHTLEFRQRLSVIRLSQESRAESSRSNKIQY